MPPILAWGSPTKVRISRSRVLMANHVIAGNSAPSLLDAWRVAHPGQPHDPTFRIYEKQEPGEPELHCDFIFVSEGLRTRVKRLWVDTATQVSDHQPVLLELR